MGNLWLMWFEMKELFQGKYRYRPVLSSLPLGAGTSVTSAFSSWKPGAPYCHAESERTRRDGVSRRSYRKWKLSKELVSPLRLLLSPWLLGLVIRWDIWLEAKHTHMHITAYTLQVVYPNASVPLLTAGNVTAGIKRPKWIPSCSGVRQSVDWLTITRTTHSTPHLTPILLTSHPSEIQTNGLAPLPLITDRCHPSLLSIFCFSHFSPSQSVVPPPPYLPASQIVTVKSKPCQTVSDNCILLGMAGPGDINMMMFT